MSEMKSHFGGFSGYGQNNFLLDSLSVATADTRKGLDQTTATRIAAMQGYVNAHPEKTNAESFKAYVGKIVSASSDDTKPMAVAQRKPTTGMMS